MKRTALTTLAVIVVLVAVASSIAGSAIAGESEQEETELTWVSWCSVNEDHCKNPHPRGSLTLDMQLVAGQKALILSALGTMECSESQTQAKEVGEEPGTAIPAAVTKMTFSGCQLGEEACSFEVEGPEWYLLLLNANSEYHLLLEPIPNVSFSCGESIECGYGGGEEAGVVLLTIEKLATDTDAIIPGQVFLHESGESCPETVTLDARYLIKCLKPAGTTVSCWPAMLKAGF